MHGYFVMASCALQMGGEKSLFGRKKESGTRTPTHRGLKRDLKDKMAAKPRFIKKKKCAASANESTCDVDHAIMFRFVVLLQDPGVPQATQTQAQGFVRRRPGHVDAARVRGGRGGVAHRGAQPRNITLTPSNWLL